MIAAHAPIRFMVLAILLLAGCGRSEQAAVETDEDAMGLTASASHGPVEIVLRINKRQVRVAEPLELEAEVIAPNGVEVEWPGDAETLGDWQIIAVSTTEAVPDSDERRWQQRWELETYTSGEVAVPPITVGYTGRDAAESDASRDDEPLSGDITVGPLAVSVVSALTPDAGGDEFRDIKGAVEVPVPRRWGWLLWLGLAAVLVSAAAFGWWWWRRRRAARHGLARAITPHDWALDMLSRLRDERLVEQGRVQEFFFGLSYIIRGYIERRFAIMAGEQTTDEFLLAVRDDSRLSHDDKMLLGDFLTAADMVKFARHEPDPNEVETALSAAEDFVRQTAPSETKDGRSAGRPARAEAVA